MESTNIKLNLNALKINGVPPTTDQQTMPVSSLPLATPSITTPAETLPQAVVSSLTPTPLVQTIPTIPVIQNEPNKPSDPQKIESPRSGSGFQSIKLPKINFSAMQKSINQDQAETTKKNLEKTQNENDAKAQMVEEKVPELFHNYKPSFDGRAKKFFEHLRELRLKPRTRTSLIGLLIFGTFGFIGYLFYFHPENHSLKVYQASILHVFSKKESSISPQEKLSSTGTTSKDSEPTGTDETIPSQNQAPANTNETEKSTDVRNQKIKQYFSK